LAFATFLVWRLRTGACGFGAIECPPHYDLKTAELCILYLLFYLRQRFVLKKTDNIPWVPVPSADLRVPHFHRPAVINGSACVSLTVAR